jgi:hypothetical protein
LFGAAPQPHSAPPNKCHSLDTHFGEGEAGQPGGAAVSNNSNKRGRDEGKNKIKSKKVGSGGWVRVAAGIRARGGCRNGWDSNAWAASSDGGMAQVKSFADHLAKYVPAIAATVESARRLVDGDSARHSVHTSRKGPCSGTYRRGDISTMVEQPQITRSRSITRASGLTPSARLSWMRTASVGFRIPAQCPRCTSG